MIPMDWMYPKELVQLRMRKARIKAPPAFLYFRNFVFPNIILQGPQTLQQTQIKASLSSYLPEGKEVSCYDWECIGDGDTT